MLPQGGIHDGGWRRPELWWVGSAALVQLLLVVSPSTGGREGRCLCVVVSMASGWPRA
jgi:hypothetical protein